MNVYVLHFEPFGELVGDCSTDIVGVFTTRKEAVYKAFSYIEADVFEGDYFVDLNELKEFVKGNSNFVEVHFKSEINYSQYYELSIWVKELIE